MNGRNWEYASEDPLLSGQFATAVVQGIQSEHVIATVKHFIANSQETNRMSDSSDLSERTLQEIYAPQYEAAVRRGGAGSVMCSYNRINGTYACENPTTLGMLDHQFGFDGFVVSDWDATHSTVASTKAGLDMEMSVGPGTYYGSALQTAVQSGQVPMATLNTMVTRIVRSMFRIGLFDHPAAAQPGAFAANVSTPAHVALARRLAEAGTVLLKNEGSILPLGGPGKTIAVIGPGAGQAGAENEYGGQGSGHVPEFGSVPVVSPQTAITRRAAAAGDTVLYSDGSSAPAAAATARLASVAVVFAGDSESEGTDRADLTLRGGTCTLGGCTPQTVDQNALIAAVAAANPRTVVVLNTGGPVLMPWLSSVKGLFEAWYPGQEDGNAIAALLYGDVDPSARLPETFPAAPADLPLRSARQWPGVPDGAGVPHSSYSEGLLVGYRWYDAKHIAPLFPFGFGLDYTSFRYMGLTLRSGGTPGAAATATVQRDQHGAALGRRRTAALPQRPRIHGRTAPSAQGRRAGQPRPGPHGCGLTRHRPAGPGLVELDSACLDDHSGVLRRGRRPQRTRSGRRGHAGGQRCALPGRGRGGDRPPAGDAGRLPPDRGPDRRAPTRTATARHDLGADPATAARPGLDTARLRQVCLLGARRRAHRIRRCPDPARPAPSPAGRAARPRGRHPRHRPRRVAARHLPRNASPHRHAAACPGPVAAGHRAHVVRGAIARVAARGASRRGDRGRGRRPARARQPRRDPAAARRARLIGG